uniref:Integrin beta-6 n=1 Tax=Lygus hesperus TaxID=30085 RepID=A0A0A9WK04_LYGHE
MWTPGSVAASTKIMGRMLWPLARSSIRSQGSNCCPPVDVCEKKCVPCDPPPPPPRRLTRCELPGAMDDPCCSRQPKCPDPCNKDKKEDECDTDCPDRPRPPDPCKIEGEICSEEPCEFKKPEKCCSQTPAKDISCCPRRQKTKKKKRVIKKTCCLNLDPNWPPKRPECDCGFPAKELGPCVQAKSPKKEFWDGLC